MNQTEPIQLIGDTREALQGVRQALIELYGVVGANTEAPQVVSRRYGINRNLTWKLTRIIKASDPFDALNHLPGDQGIELAIRAFEKAGAPSEVLARVRSAMQMLKATIAEHAGTREDLELTLESMGVLDRDGGGAESGRELAFRGNSMVWGARADTRYVVCMLTPGASSGTADMALVVGLLGFRRLRPSVQWRLFRSQAGDDSGRVAPGADIEEFEPHSLGDTPQCIREFCSPNMPPLTARRSGPLVDYYLPGGQVGRQAGFDCFMGYIRRNLPMYRTPEHRFGSCGTAITLPIETLVIDLIVHRDITMDGRPEVQVFGYPEGGATDPSTQSTLNALPCNDRFVDLAGSPPAVYSPVIACAPRVLERMFSRMEQDPSCFRGSRLLSRFPPMSSLYSVKWGLPERAGA